MGRTVKASSEVKSAVEANAKKFATGSGDEKLGFATKPDASVGPVHATPDVALASDAKTKLLVIRRMPRYLKTHSR